MTATAEQYAERITEIEQEQAGAEAVRQLLEAGTEAHRETLDAAIDALRAYVDARKVLAEQTVRLDALRRKARRYSLPVPPTDSYAQRYAGNTDESYEIRCLHADAQIATRGGW
jgi:hypothetical protein